MSGVSPGPTHQFVFDAVRVLSLSLLDPELQLQSMKLQKQVVDLLFYHRLLGFNVRQLGVEVDQLRLERIREPEDVR